MAKLTGAKKKAFLERMAKGRKKATRNGAKRKPAAKKKAKKNPSVRKSKKTIAKGFTKPLAAEWAKKKRTAKKRTHAKKRKAPAKNPKKRTASKKRTAAQEKRYQLLVQKFGPARAAQLWKATNPAPRKRKPAAKKTNSHRHRGKRRNSSMTDAEAMFETFHQKPAGKIVDYEQLVHYQSAFAQLGKLKELRIYLDDDNTDFPFTRFGAAEVACTPDGRNIYFLGGDQAIDLEALDIASDKDMVELGPCTYIAYHTVKGFHDFEPTTYWHLFGEEDDIRPILCYDRLNKQLFLMGGNYTVKYDGIVN